MVHEIAQKKRKLLRKYINVRVAFWKNHDTRNKNLQPPFSTVATNLMYASAMHWILGFSLHSPLSIHSHILSLLMSLKWRRIASSRKEEWLCGRVASWQVLRLGAEPQISHSGSERPPQSPIPASQDNAVNYCGVLLKHYIWLLM